MQHILSIGAEPSLLYTRGLVLERTGAAVISATPSAALRLIENGGGIDLLVFCHTVRDEELSVLCEASRIGHLGSRIILIESTSGSRLSQPRAAWRFSLEDGPALLVRIARDMLLGVEKSVLAKCASGSRMVAISFAASSDRIKYAPVPIDRGRDTL